MSDQDSCAGSLLVIDLVDHDRLDVSAGGSLSSAACQLVRTRLNQLLSCGFVHLRIDFTGVSTVAPSVVDVVLQAASELAEKGGRLEITNLQSVLTDRLGVLTTPKLAVEQHAS